MKTLTTLVLALLAVFLMTSGVVRAQSAPDAQEIMKKSHMAYYYAGDDGVAKVNMQIVDKKGKERIREFVMLRLDIVDGGDQMYYTYFNKPSDVSRLTFMVHKHADANDERWIYIPSVDLVKQISADDKNSSFVGSDFTYEDVSGRHWTEDNHKTIGDSTLNDKAVWIIESVPKKPYKGFAKKISYIDKKTFLPLREYYYDKKGKLARIMTAEKIEDADGIITITKRSMKDVKKNRITYVTFNNIDYNVGLKKDIFTERYLVNPPMKYIK